MSKIGTIIRGKYFDSVKLMLISKELRQREGINDAVAIMATTENRAILAATDMLLPEFDQASDADICVAIDAVDEASAQKLLHELDDILAASAKGGGDAGEHDMQPRSIGNAVKQMPDANLAVISVAGKYAGAEAEKALDNNLHVLLFSDNVSLETEKHLKEKALGKGLLMMGPDCGTAIINGIPLAFSNAVRKGRIGMVSASGTGLQEVSCVIHNLGYGISQAFGTGGRDGKKAIGGLMILACLDYLIHDPNTDVIVLISKVPDEEVMAKIWEYADTTDKPIVVNFLKTFVLPVKPNLHAALTLADTGYAACYLQDKQEGKPPRHPFQRHKQDCQSMVSELALPKQPRKYLRGLYSGGTLCYEAQGIFTNRFDGRHAYSNAPLDDDYLLTDVWVSREHTIVDLGADEFTVGRPHPMIDYSLRLKKIEDEIKDPEIAILLLDVVLGYGANLAPHLELAPLLHHVTETSEVVVICTVLGTDDDPQVRNEVIATLAEAGAIVTETNAEAVELAVEILRKLN